MTRLLWRWVFGPSPIPRNARREMRRHERARRAADVARARQLGEQFLADGADR